MNCLVRPEIVRLCGHRDLLSGDFAKASDVIDVSREEAASMLQGSLNAELSEVQKGGWKYSSTANLPIISIM